MKLLKMLSISLLLVNAVAFSMQRETSISPVQLSANLQDLPADVKVLIVSALTQSKSLDEASEAISNLTQIKNKQFYSLINDPKTIESIIKNIAGKFKVPVTLVAAKLNTFGSQLWLSDQVFQNPNLGTDALSKAIDLHDVIAVKNLLKAGVNPNRLMNGYSALDEAWSSIVASYRDKNRVSEKDKAIMKALIDAGAFHHGSYGSSVMTDPIIKELQEAGINRWKNLNPAQSGYPRH